MGSGSVRYSSGYSAHNDRFELEVIRDGPLFLCTTMATFFVADGRPMVELGGNVFLWEELMERAQRFFDEEASGGFWTEQSE